MSYLLVQRTWQARVRPAECRADQSINGAIIAQMGDADLTLRATLFNNFEHGSRNIALLP
ncbi:hypothetical protein [Candidatus Pantoea soli]|uniref:hypothetical protein n=1 Tax=Candidatus Pantoea soli TaxID=3098669 RepID=UPI0011A5BA9E|nr:hypothetical protein [Pantoea soli]